MTPGRPRRTIDGGKSPGLPRKGESTSITPLADRTRRMNIYSPSDNKENIPPSANTRSCGKNAPESSRRKLFGASAKVSPNESRSRSCKTKAPPDYSDMDQDKESVRGSCRQQQSSPNAKVSLRRSLTRSCSKKGGPNYEGLELPNDSSKRTRCSLSRTPVKPKPSPGRQTQSTGAVHQAVAVNSKRKVLKFTGSSSSSEDKSSADENGESPEKRARMTQDKLARMSLRTPHKREGNENGEKSEALRKQCPLRMTPTRKRFGPYYGYPDNVKVDVSIFAVKTEKKAASAEKTVDPKIRSVRRKTEIENPISAPKLITRLKKEAGGGDSFRVTTTPRAADTKVARVVPNKRRSTRFVKQEQKEEENCSSSSEDDSEESEASLDGGTEEEEESGEESESDEEGVRFVREEEDEEEWMGGRKRAERPGRPAKGVRGVRGGVVASPSKKRHAKGKEQNEEPVAMGPPRSLAGALDRLSSRNPHGTLRCREDECEKIRHFIQSAASLKGISQAAYISGVPGTGKTACVLAMVQEVRKQRGSPHFVFIHVNAMFFTDAKQLFAEVYREYVEQTRQADEKRPLKVAGATARKRLNALFETVDRTRPAVILLVDELDQLSTKKQELIYDIFNWTALEESRVSVLSIANTLDLPERTLNQRITSRLGMNRIVFQPYTHDQLEYIISAKLGYGGGKGKKEKEEDRIVNEDALQMAARKVAAISGDLRKAMDILKAAINIAISRGLQQLTMELVAETVKSSTNSLLVHAVCALSTHQLFLFDAAVSIVQKTNAEDFSLNELLAEYMVMCRAHYDREPINEDGLYRLILRMNGSALTAFSGGPSALNAPRFLRRIRVVPSTHDARQAVRLAVEHHAEKEQKEGVPLALCIFYKGKKN